jgi:hypothetical protein
LVFCVWCLKKWRLSILATLASFFLLALVGCGQSEINKGLESDANGYLCTSCQTKFYTDRSVFAGHCPQCQQPGVQLVVGVVCPADKHATLFARGRGSGVCEQCGKPVQAIFIPGEKELKAWGAAKKTAAEVGG